MSSNEVKVGALTLGGIGLLAGIITFLGAFSFSGSGYKLQISYPQVGGLMPGHVVRYAGVQVGTVKEVNVNGDSVDVVADINKDIKIPKGAVFSLGSDGILGERFVDVLPPVKMTGQYIHPGDKLEGEQGTGLDEFMNASSKVLAKVEGIAEALNNVFGDPEVQRSMRDGFVNARDISNNMNTFTKVMADVAVANQQEINLMVQQMSEMAVRMNNAASQMENIMVETNKGGAGQNMARIIENLANASGRIEKAHADVFNVLLQVLDDGRLTDGQGRNVDFKNTLIIMTSNLGSAEIMKKQGQISREDIQSMLMQFFRPEFLNRVDDIVVFKALEKEQINDIVKMILKELGERLEKQLDLTLVCSDEAVAYLADTGFDPAFGARPLKRLIVHTVENLLGRKIVSGEIKSGETVRVVLKNGVIDIEQVS